MGMRIYPLSSMEIRQNLYLLDLSMGIGINFFHEDGYEIVKLVPTPPHCHPYMRMSVMSS